MLCRAHSGATAGTTAAAAASSTAAAAQPPVQHQQQHRQRVALVQGSSRGLGLEFVRQLLQRPDTASVVATCRQPAAAAQLAALQAQHGAARLQILQLDSTDEGSIAGAAQQVAAQHDHLDLLINASGILHDSTSGMSPETALARVSMDNLVQCFTVNAAGHILVCQAFAPLLANAARANGATE